jgi:hypothetical protein
MSIGRALLADLLLDSAAVLSHVCSMFHLGMRPIALCG